uniref:RING-type domain-containing protein n=1 Tax=Daucus carota subsp. sativus TaxID=79200 RepID=A0A175YIS6_DAUCS
MDNNNSNNPDADSKAPPKITGDQIPSPAAGESNSPPAENINDARQTRTAFTELSQERAYMMIRMNGDGSDYGSWETGSYSLALIVVAGYSEELDDRGGDSQDAWEEVDPDNLSYEELLALGDVVGTESRGLSADTIASLPSMSFKMESNQDGNMESCVICRLDYEEGDTLTLLSCKHSYHPECIDNWSARFVALRSPRQETVSSDIIGVLIVKQFSREADDDLHLQVSKLYGITWWADNKSGSLGLVSMLLCFLLA